MKAADEIAGILRQWLQLTRAEGEAIKAEAWSSLAFIQERKKTVQETFETLRPVEASFRPQIAQILSLLSRNAQALNAALTRARDRRAELSQTRRTLGRLQSSYGVTSAAALRYSLS